MLRFPTVTTGQRGSLREMAGNYIEFRSTKMATNNNLLVGELIDRVSELSQAIATNQTQNKIVKLDACSIQQVIVVNIYIC